MSDDDKASPKDDDEARDTEPGDGDESGESFLTDGPEGDQPMSFFDHLADLRKRLMWSVVAIVGGFILAWIFVKDLQDFLTFPLAEAWARVDGLPDGRPRLQNLGVFDAFLTHIRIAVTASLFLSAPVVFYQLWMFVAPGLYAREKKVVVPFVGTSAVMFILGAGFCYKLVIPVATQWFLEYPLHESGPDALVEIASAYTFTDYIKYVTRLLLAFGLVFEFPLLIFFLARIGAVTHRTLIRHWKISVVGSFVIGAFLTPPEPITQLLMATPMIVMYFGSIGVAYWASKPYREQMARLDKELAEDEAAEAREAQEGGDEAAGAEDDDDDAW